MYKLLVPVDGSEPSKRAVKAATDIASGKEQAEITILYVSPSSVYFPYHAPMLSVDDDLLEIEKKQGNELLEETIKEASATSKATFKKKHLYGNAAKEIVEYADDTKQNMIVMGNRGMGAFGQMILGSVSNKVLHLSKCPVLIVK